eukprot:4191784-Amphidinium_carterae.2
MLLGLKVKTLLRERNTTRCMLSAIAQKTADGQSPSSGSDVVQYIEFLWLGGVEATNLWIASIDNVVVNVRYEFSSQSAVSSLPPPAAVVSQDVPQNCSTCGQKNPSPLRGATNPERLWLCHGFRSAR